MSNKTKLALLIILIFSLGLWVGEASYKRTCEPVGNAQGQRWLECTE